VSDLAPHAGGFESDCWVADGRWFVKVWREGSPAQLDLLAQLAARGLPVPPPTPTVDGGASATVAGRALVVFPFVAGREGTDEDWVETARCLRRVHATTDLAAPVATMDEWCVDALRQRLQHPWIADRGEELARWVDRLEGVIDAARHRPRPAVLCHNDIGPHNLLLDDRGLVVAILDWDYARLAPREHDLWLVLDLPDPEAFLVEYAGGESGLELDPVHAEYALLARALRDLAARVCTERDRPGVDTWGFDRLARLPALLQLLRDFGRS
jgi:Ser/Thr protein kinase RdoA (MazF antagonist)